VSSYAAKQFGAGELGQEVAGDVGGLVGGGLTEGLYQGGKPLARAIVLNSENKARLPIKMLFPKRANILASWLKPSEVPPPVKETPFGPQQPTSEEYYKSMDRLMKDQAREIAASKEIEPPPEPAGKYPSAEEFHEIQKRHSEFAK